jgi:hypothetical protein
MASIAMPFCACSIMSNSGSMAFLPGCVQMIPHYIWKGLQANRFLPSG